jgi:hypothetical protein
MLPPIEFFVGMLAGGLLAFIAIMVGSGSEEARVRGVAEHDMRHGE